jgi:hypothetical protein
MSHKHTYTHIYIYIYILLSSFVIHIPLSLPSRLNSTNIIARNYKAVGISGILDFVLYTTIRALCNPLGGSSYIIFTDPQTSHLSYFQWLRIELVNCVRLWKLISVHEFFVVTNATGKLYKNYIRSTHNINHRLCS